MSLADSPIDAYTVFSQRLSVLVQYKHNTKLPKPEFENPWNVPAPPMQQYDNGNTIIIFDNSNNYSIKDTLISARGEWESKWVGFSNMDTRLEAGTLDTNTRSSEDFPFMSATLQLRMRS